MAEVTATLVRELREKCGAGMMDCKKALVENNGDIEAAMDWLRQKGLASAAKKSGRAAAEGLVGAVSEGTTGVVVELNAETDFVARNESFQKFLTDVTRLALKEGGDIDTLKAAKMEGGTVEEGLTKLIATVGENMVLRRVKKVSVENGVVATYLHNSMTPECGKIGVLVALESTADADALNALGRQIAMHIAATRPESLTVDSLDQDLIERERAVYLEQAKESGKPDDIAEKMVEGRLRKYYEQVVLLEQTYVIDGETKVADVVEKAAKDLGAPVKLVDFVRFELGEGVEKAEDNFADEVSKMAAGG